MSGKKKLDFDTWFIIIGFGVVVPCYFFWEPIKGFFSGLFSAKGHEVADVAAVVSEEALPASAEAVVESVSEVMSVSMPPSWFTGACIVLICVLCAVAFGLYFGYKRHYNKSAISPSMDLAAYNYFKSLGQTCSSSSWGRIGEWLVYPLIAVGVVELVWCLVVGFDNAGDAYWQFAPERDDNGWIVTWIYNILYYACLSAQLMTTVVLCRRDVGFVKWICVAVSFAGLGVMILFTAPFVWWLGPLTFGWLYGCLPRTQEEQEEDAWAKREAQRKRESDAANGMPWRNFERRYDSSGNVTYERIEHNDGSVETSGSRGSWGSNGGSSSSSRNRDFDHDDGYGNKHNNRYQSLHWTLKASRDDCRYWNSSGCQFGCDRNPCGYEYNEQSCPYFKESANYTRKVDRYLKDGTI